MNSLESYFHAGRKTGEARRHRDQGTVTHWQQWFIRACRLETPEYRLQAQEQFNRGYRESTH